jgi:hypothetical protein
MFEPTRLSAEQLHRAYELIVAPVQREVRRTADVAGPDVRPAASKDQRKGRAG